MIGRKRRRQASRIASKGARPRAALSLEREVDHHDRVLLDDADQHQDADHRDDAEVEAEQPQRAERADRGRRQARQDRQGMDEALVEDAEHDVDRHTAAASRRPWLPSASWKTCAVPAKVVEIVVGTLAAP